MGVGSHNEEDSESHSMSPSSGSTTSDVAIGGGKLSSPLPGALSGGEFNVSASAVSTTFSESLKSVKSLLLASGSIYVILSKCVMYV